MIPVILGASGFIGSSIKLILEEKYKIKALAIDSSNMNLLDKDAVVNQLPQAVSGNPIIFCAGRHRQYGDSFKLLESNVHIISNICEALSISRPSQFIFLSSIEVYGKPKKNPISESSLISPNNYYSVGKIAAEQMLKIHCSQLNIPLSILRLPGIYGLGDSQTSIVGKLIQSTMGNATFKLIGSGVDQRDYVYVNDIGRIIKLLFSLEHSLITLNVATGHSHRIIDIVELVESIWAPCRLDKTVEKSTQFDIRFDISKFRKTFKNFQFTSLREGLNDYRIKLEKDELRE